MYEEYEYLNYEFPTKEEISSLRKKRERMRKNYFRMRRLCEESESFCGGANYADQNGNWVERKDAVYMRRWYRNQCSTWVKKLCNRKFRREGIVTSSRGAQRKMTEYWWMMY